MPTWRLEKTFRFEASHQLPLHDGKCKRLHGHTWVGRVAVEGDTLAKEGAKTGMVMDYGDISAVINPLVASHLDHYHLNESTGLENPTSEELARWIYERLKPALWGLVEVTIEETCTCKATYRP